MERKRKLIPKKRYLGALLATTLALHGCGGGDDTDWLFPLWVPTDVLVADIDGNGHADILTLAQYATDMEKREGRLVVRLQTAAGVYAPAQTYVVGIYPWTMAVDDIDGDGAADLVVADVGDSASTSTTDEAVWMLRQDASNPGRFLVPQRLTGDPTRPYDLAIGDVSGDGVPDIVLADPLLSGRGATLLVQDAKNRGTFLAPALIPLPGNATEVALGDVNQDGLDDLVFRMVVSVTNYIQSTQLGIVYQLADGTLVLDDTLSPQTGLNTQMLALTDYDIDGATDVVEFFTPSSTDFQAKVTALLQDPLGTFSAVDTSLVNVKGIDDGVTADLNADGRPDFATVGFYPVGSPTTVYSTLNLFMQDGSGGYTQTAAIAMPISASRLAAGDIDGDGRNDLVVLGGENQVLLLLQSASQPGTFLAPQLLD
jgi:hypothetical protein